MRLLFSILFSALSMAIFAQTAQVKGTVTDTKNEPVPFANVVVEGTTVGSVTDFDGKFEINSITPGFIRIKASAVGFQTVYSEEVMVTPAKPLTLNLEMPATSTELNEVVVKASPFMKKEEAPLSMRSLGLSEIERNPGGNRDISKVIQSLPGVASSASFRNDIIIRGGAPNENRFYLDGIEVPNINHFATQGASGGPVGVINADLISEVQLYSGAFPSNRGNALSSVMEFSLKEGNNEKLHFRTTLGSSDLGLTLDGPIGEKTTFMFSVRRSYLQFLFSVLELPFLPTYNDYQYKFKTKLNTNNEITFIGLGALDQFALNTEANETAFQRYILNNLPVNNQWNYTWGANYKHIGKKAFQTFTFSRNMLNNTSEKYENNIENPENKVLDYRSQEIENKLRFENTIRSNQWKINFGANLEFLKYYNSTYNRISRINPVTSMNQIDTIEYDATLEGVRTGLFGQVSNTFLNNRLLVSVGFRADGINVNEEMENPFNQFSPRISLSYTVSDKWSINANSGIFYQLPAYTILGFQANNDFINLDQAKFISSNHYVTGVEYRPNLFQRFTVEGFLKQYDNYPVSAANQISLANLGADFGVIGNEEVIFNGQGRAYGLEFLYQRKMFKNVYGILAYTLVRSEFKDQNNNYIPSAWDSEHLLTFTGGKKFKNNWEVGLRWRYVHGRPYTPINVDQSSLRASWDIAGIGLPDYSQLNTLKLDPFHQLDLRIDKVFYLANTTLNLYIDIQNAYNYQANGVPILNLVEDSNNQPIIENPGAPYNQQRYQTQVIQGTDGTLLPTLGIIFDL